jgi:uncharacterized protein YbjT (DUF2867 family)
MMMNAGLLFVVLCVLLAVCAEGVKVVVTGAGGRTGSLVMQKLLKMPEYEAVGLIRTAKSKSKITKIGGKADNICIADVTDVDSLVEAFQGAEKVIMCTSAVPQIKPLSIAKIFLGKILGKSERPEFKFIPNGDPYNVDWLGAKNQIDAAKKAGVKQFVFLSSMGGTDPDNFLNTIGRTDDDKLSGNILLWKRKAEEYLIKAKIPSYTIVHPGGLLDKKGGEREIVFGIDDKLLKETVRSIPREDVAEVCVQALKCTGAKNRAFDIISREPGTGDVTTDWNKFFKAKGNSKYGKTNVGV